MFLDSPPVAIMKIHRPKNYDRQLNGVLSVGVSTSVNIPTLTYWSDVGPSPGGVIHMWKAGLKERCQFAKESCQFWFSSADKRRS